MTSASAGTEVELAVPAHLAFRDQSGPGIKWFRNRGRSSGQASKPESKTK
jgi:hypothetical protein